MYAAPPVANLLVIRSPNIVRAVTFYQQMGILFVRHAHGSGPEHYASDVCGFVFKIYPQRNADDITTNARIGFNVDDVDGIIEMLREIDARIISEPADTERGRRAVVKDFDSHTVELVTPVNREAMIVKNYNDASRFGNAKDAN